MLKAIENETLKNDQTTLNKGKNVPSIVTTYEWRIINQHNKRIELDLNQYVTTYLLHSGNSNIEACTLLNDAWCNILNISWSEIKWTEKQGNSAIDTF